MIEIHLDNKSPRSLDGMRRWLAYVQTEVVKKMHPTVTLKDSRPGIQTYFIGDTLCTFETITSQNGTMLTLKLSSTTRTGQKSEVVPVPAMIILMVVLHLLGGRKAAGAMVELQANIGSKVYNTKAQVPEVYRSLKAMVPPAWYLPYAEDVKASDEFFNRTPTAKPTSAV